MYLLYLLVLKHLPPIYYPGGAMVKAIRYYFSRGCSNPADTVSTLDQTLIYPFIKWK